MQPGITADPRAGKLLEAGLALASELSLPKVLQRIVDLATEVTGARYGALGVIGPDGWLMEFVTTGITQAEREAIGSLPRGHGILGVLIDDARPLRLPDLSAHPKSYGFPPNHPPMRSFLGVPVTARRGVRQPVHDREAGRTRVRRSGRAGAGDPGGAGADLRAAGVGQSARGEPVTVEVDDDGRDFDPTTPAGGHGLRNLHARGRALGGRTELLSTPGEGTTIRLTVPVGGPSGGAR